ncbi:MAG: DUF192 domain-containing protein [Leptospira sp.]|jgi:uncharacterized membrane protein (UPF0127 family)|nr:DUF192 domain-containing protein [Leptospira sp.]
MLLRLFVFFILFVFESCQPADSYPTQMETVFASLGDKAIRLEVANNPSTRAVGLMHRTEMSDDQGMLFVFPRSEPLSFWMKNTLIPLSLGYFDGELKLLETHDMKPNQTNEVYNSQKPAKYALEVNVGWFKKNKIAIGTYLILDRKISARD